MQVILKFLFIIIIISNNMFSQHNFINNNEIYKFLERQEILGRITVNSHQKPFSRAKIKSLLEQLKLFKNSFNTVEKKEWIYWLKEYSSFKESLNKEYYFFEFNKSEAFRFFEYHDSIFYFTAYPDFGGSYSKYEENASILSYYNGFSAYGNINDFFSFDLDFNDVSNKLNKILFYDYYNFRAFDYTRGKNGQIGNYDRTLGSITLNWDWGYFSIKKDYNYWGNNYNGNIIFSDRAPSFPQIYLNFNPVEWLEFNYLYGELMSGVEDSTSFRETGFERDHILLVDKYIAAHFLTLNFWKNLKVSLGGSVVISDKFEPIYLVPVLFFRIADHYLSETDNNSGNAQIFTSISYIFPDISTKFDLSLFFDELSYSNLFGNDRPNRIGYSFGITNYDIFFENLGIKAEYVRLDPYVYEHSDPAQTFYNRSYPMGHWMKSNSEMLFYQVSYKPLYNMWASFSGTYIRRGDIEDSEMIDENPARSFLHGEKSYILRFSSNITYEILNNVKLYSELVVSNSWGNNNIRNIKQDKFIEFSTGFSIGF